MESRRSLWGRKGWFHTVLKSRNNTCHTQFQSDFFFCFLISFHPTLTWHFPPPSDLRTESVRQKKHLSSLWSHNAWTGYINVSPDTLTDFWQRINKENFQVVLKMNMDPNCMIDSCLRKPLSTCYKIFWTQIRIGKWKPKQLLRFYFPLGLTSVKMNSRFAPVVAFLLGSSFAQQE